MKRYLLILFIGIHSVSGQGLSVNNLVAAVSLPSSRADNFVSQRGFQLTGSDQQNGATIYNYQYRPKGKAAKTDSVQRFLSRQAINNSTSLAYQTSCINEFNVFKDELKDAGFISYDNSDSTGFFQREDMTVQSGVSIVDSHAVYSFWFRKNLLPPLKDIMYAEDLLAFDSHENLVYVFGANNVKKDLYYFSEKEFSYCSVLYPNTERQAVFIWKDEKNRYDLHHIIFGGQLMVGGSINYDEIVGQNSWVFKDQLQVGMSLGELRRFNAADFNFYSTQSAYSGMVLPATNGKINFEKETVVLACLNCDNGAYAKTERLSADDAISSGARFFIFSIMLYKE